jgi:hypothetical protein
MKESTTSKSTTGTPSDPAFPARLVLTAYSTLSPAIGLFVTVTCKVIASQV